MAKKTDEELVALGREVFTEVKAVLEKAVEARADDDVDRGALASWVISSLLSQYLTALPPEVPVRMWHVAHIVQHALERSQGKPVEVSVGRTRPPRVTPPPGSTN